MTGCACADDVGISVKPLARSSALRVAHAAFRYARSEGRATVTAVHKATVMRATDGVFLEAAREAAGEFPDVRFDERLVDATCHDLVVRPESFDVLLAPVMYGDLLADLCAGLIGGLGLAPGASYGDGCAVFEPVHGTAMRLAGTNTANPMATILSGAMLLRHVGEAEAAGRVEAAVAAVVEDGSRLTYDLRPGRRRDGAATTPAVAAAVIAALGVTSVGCIPRLAITVAIRAARSTDGLSRRANTDERATTSCGSSRRRFKRALGGADARRRRGGRVRRRQRMEPRPVLTLARRVRGSRDRSKARRDAGSTGSRPKGSGPC